MDYLYLTAIGQDSHRFWEEGSELQRQGSKGDEWNSSGEGQRPMLLAGLPIPDAPKIRARSDGDVLYHALTNAVSGLSGINVLGPPADALCDQGIVDSLVYLEKALADLGSIELIHLSISVEALRPKLYTHIPAIRERLAEVLDLDISCIGLTATTGEGLSAMGRGEGVAVTCILSARKRVDGGSESIGFRKEAKEFRLS